MSRTQFIFAKFIHNVKAIFGLELPHKSIIFDFPSFFRRGEFPVTEFMPVKFIFKLSTELETVL